MSSHTWQTSAKTAANTPANTLANTHVQTLAQPPARTPAPLEPATAVGAEALMAALDALDTGVMVCDARGRLLLQNHAARREIATGGVLQLAADGLLDVAGGAGLLALRRAVHGAAFGHSHHLVPLRHGTLALMLAVQPLRAADGAPQRVLLLTGRRGLCPDLAVQHLGRLHGLTPAEVSVLSSLLLGVRIGAMARARGVKLSTVRTQVAALRAKLGVQRLDDITRLVAELPPMLGALSRHSAWPEPLQRPAHGPPDLQPQHQPHHPPHQPTHPLPHQPPPAQALTA